jgi:hypothetical protein
MGFQYACFISYRHHEQSETAGRFIDDLCTALRNELSMQAEPGVYIDRERILGGTRFDPALAGALCRSACMLLVYTPLYFSTEHLYCAREFRAMETLEDERLRRLADRSLQEHGLIIPVVLRGGDRLPAVLRQQRHAFDFGGFSLRSESLKQHPDYEPRVREVAQVILHRLQLLESLGDALDHDCSRFQLPPEDEVRRWVGGLRAPVAPFPIGGA